MHPSITHTRLWNRAMLTLLTATGCRNSAFSICQQLMMQQTYRGKVHWIIVDDGETPQDLTFLRENWTLTIVRPEPFWKEGVNTQARNLIAGMTYVNKDAKLLVIEDDDYYDPNYLQMVDGWLNKHDLVGECMSRYYNFATRKHRQLSNNQHASLSSTAMKADAIYAFERELKPQVKFIDINLWRNFNGAKQLYPTKMVVGVKGLAGRKGIGMGHSSEFNGQIDAHHEVFKRWIGKQASLYEY